MVSPVSARPNHDNMATAVTALTQTPPPAHAPSLKKNFAWLAAASIFTKVINVFVVAYVARVLAAEGYGQLGFAAAATSYFVLISNLGLDSHAVREVARQPSSLRRRVDQITTLKLVTTLLSFVILLVLVFCIHKPLLVKQLMVLTFLASAISTFRLNWVFTGLERLRLVAVATVVEQLANAALVFILLHSAHDLLRAPVVAAGSFAAGAAVLYYLYYREFGKISLAFDWPAWKTILRESLPMGVSAILVTVYCNFDTVMLSFMRSDREVGWYNAAYKLILAVISFRYMMTSTVLPRVSALFIESRERLETLVHKLYRLLFIVCIPMAVGGTVLAGQIIHVMYGAEYAPAEPALQILIWTAAMFITNAVFPVVLCAANRQMDETVAVLIAAALNIIANFLLIPTYGMVGAAVATVLADMAMWVWMYERSRRVLSLRILPLAVVPFLSAAIMGASLCWIRHWSLFVTIPVGTVVYTAALFAMRGLTSVDVKFIFEFLPSSWGKR